MISKYPPLHCTAERSEGKSAKRSLASKYLKFSNFWREAKLRAFSFDSLSQWQSWGHLGSIYGLTWCNPRIQTPSSKLLFATRSPISSLLFSYPVFRLKLISWRTSSASSLNLWSPIRGGVELGVGLAACFVVLKRDDWSTVGGRGRKEPRRRTVPSI